MSEAVDEDDPERAINGIISVAQLLEKPRLARLYTFVLKTGPVTIDDVVEELDVPRTTAYSDAGTLADLGLLVRDTGQKTHTFTATPVVLSADLDGDTYTITPTLLEAVGRAPADRDLDLLLDRHGLGKLAAALTYAIPYAEGNVGERVAARELDIQPAFGIAVLQALRDVVIDMRSHDPYFDRIRTAVTESPNEGA